jgi:hypothetical protein
MKKKKKNEEPKHPPPKKMKNMKEKKTQEKTRLDIHINRNTNAASKRRTRRDVGFFSVVVVPLLLIDAASVFLDEPRK